MVQRWTCGVWGASLQVRLPGAEGLCFTLLGVPYTARPAHGFLLGLSILMHVGCIAYNSKRCQEWGGMI